MGMSVWQVDALLKGGNSAFSSSLNAEVNARREKRVRYIADEVTKQIIFSKPLGQLPLLSVDDVYDLGFDKVPYPCEITRFEDAKLVRAHIKRYNEWWKQQMQRGAKILHTNLGQEVDGVYVKADIIYKIDGILYLVMIKTGEPDLIKQNKESSKNSPDKNTGLYLLMKMGERLYPGEKNMFAAYHYLTGRGKTETYFEFEMEPGANIVSEYFPTVSRIELEKKIAEAKTNAARLVFTTANCKPSECYMCPRKIYCKATMEKKLAQHQSRAKKKAKASSSFKSTKNQDKVVAFRKGILRVLAGPGSGKTTTTARRLAALIKDGTAPENVLLITFSTLGAQEIREKVEYWLEQEGLDVELANKVSIFTFNAFGEYLIHEHFDELGFTEEPRLIQRTIKMDIVVELLNKKKRVFSDDMRKKFNSPFLNMPTAQGAVVVIHDMFGVIKAKMITDDLELAKDQNLQASDARTIMELYNEFNEYLIEHNMQEFADQIDLANVLFDNDPDLVDEKYHYEHIVVDEAQDIDLSQMALMEKIMRNKYAKSFMMVGDDSQSIYGFRFTSPDSLIKFSEKFKVEDITLDDNFRSTAEIVDFTNKIDANHRNRVAKTMKAHRNGSPVTYNAVPKDEKSQHEDILAKIREYHDVKGYEYADIAVIAKTKDELLSLKDALADVGIPALLHVPEKIVQNSSFLVYQDLVQFMANRCEENSEHLYPYVFANNDCEGKTVDEVAKLVKEQFDKLMLIDPSINFVIKDAFEECKKLMQKAIDTDPVFRAYMESVRLSDFASFADYAEYLKKCVLYVDDTSVKPDIDKNADAIVLVTAHSSKGKEYPCVIVMLNKFKSKRDSLDECRRLLYVALTRAMEELHVSYETPNRGGSSPFVDEVIRALPQS